MRKLIVPIGSLLMIWLCLGCSQGEKKENPAITPVQPPVKKEDSVGNNSVRKNILFFGNSLTAGYGIDPSEAFPALIQAKLDSLKLPYQVINAGLSGETTAGGNSRIDWVLRQPVYIFVLELGGNDGLRGISLSESAKNLQIIIDKVKLKYPSAKIIMAGMQVPPNMGQKYTSEFRTMFRQLAVRNKIYLIPFLLEGVGGVPALNQHDGIHPNVQGHKIVAENIWKVLKPLL
ncbi:MAG: arylesterase [Bacteroidota bacterium]|nr:arylesterase [Bacteroidota bacterium]